MYDPSKIAQDANPPWPPISPFPPAPAPNMPGGPPAGTPPAWTFSYDTSGNPVANFPGAVNAVGVGGGGAVTSVQGRTGAVTLIAADLASMGGAPLSSPALIGTPTAPTAAPGTSNSQLATTAFVTALLGSTALVSSFNGRSGAVTLSLADVTNVGGAPLASPALTGNPTAPTQTAGTSNGTLATTAFVASALAGNNVVSWNGRTGAVILNLSDVLSVGGAPLASPGLTGTPTAPTQSPHNGSTALATTAYVDNAVTAATTGVASFNGRTGAVTLTTADVTTAGGAPIIAPNFTGVPTAPTATAGTATTQLATCAFVTAAVTGAAVVNSFNGRGGAVTLTSADLTGAGGALIASPAFTGTPSLPTGTTGITQAPGNSTTALATTAFVGAAITAAVPVASSTLPLMDSAAAIGTGTTWARADHVHPHDTTLLPLTGGALTGPLSITAPGPNNLIVQSPTGSVNLTLNKTLPGTNQIISQANGVLRWVMGLGDGTTEGGANTGSNFILSTYQDAGGPLANPALLIQRNNSTAVFTGYVQSNSGVGTAFYAPGGGGVTLDQGAGQYQQITFRNSSQVQKMLLYTDWTNSQFIMANQAAGTGLTLDGAGNFIYTGGTGQAYKIGGGAWVASSDARIKTVHGDYPQGLDDVCKLRPVIFSYKGNDSRLAGEDSPHASVTDKRFVGLVAQEVEPVFPGMVTQREGYIDGAKVEDLRDLDNSSLVYALVNAVKSLAARVETLEAALGTGA